MLTNLEIYAGSKIWRRRMSDVLKGQAQGQIGITWDMEVWIVVASPIWSTVIWFVRLQLEEEIMGGR